MDLDRKKTLLCVALVIGAGLLIAYPYIDDMMDADVGIPCYWGSVYAHQGYNQTLYTSEVQLDVSDVPPNATYQIIYADGSHSFPSSVGDRDRITLHVTEDNSLDVPKCSIVFSCNGYKFHFIEAERPLF